VYGFTAAQYFHALEQARIDTFCDIRSRRAVRGHEYSFANSRRLQAQLRKLGIRYLHFKELAPSQELRERQAAADQAAHISRRKRTQLSPEFVAGYAEECLRDFDAKEFRGRLGPEARRVVLFCVERDPEACHRSLLAKRLQKDWKVEVIHLTPDSRA